MWHSRVQCEINVFAINKTHPPIVMTAVIFKIAFVKARRYLYIYKQNSVNY